MKILASIPVELSKREIEHVVGTWLSALTNGEWVVEREGKLVLRHEVATSHRFDTDVEYQDPVRIKFVKAVQDFQDALKDYESSFQKDGRK